MAKKRVRVRVKKYRREIVKKKKGSVTFANVCYMMATCILVSLMIAQCPSQMFVEDQTGQWPRRESEMQVTIFAGSASYRHHGMESLTLRLEDGTEHPINAKDVDPKMQVLLGGKFRYVVEVKG